MFEYTKDELITYNDSLQPKENENENDNLTLDCSIDIKEDNVVEPTCLALTIRKDYYPTVIKNIFTTGRSSIS